MRGRYSKITRAVAFAVGLGCSAWVSAQTVAIQFDPDGAGPKTPVTVSTFDWAPSNLLIPGGVPAGGFQVNDKVHALLQGGLAQLKAPGGIPIAGIPDPASEFTYIIAIPLKVTSVNLGGSIVTFGWDDNSDNDPDYINKNYFEIWAGARDYSDLAGTGFNNGLRIFLGRITNVEQTLTKFQPTVDLDQFLGNDWPGQLTLSVGGSVQLSVNVWTADANYFRDFTPDKIDKVYSYFNTQGVTPFLQTDPSRKFVRGWSGGDGLSPVDPPNVTPVLGTINAQSGPDVIAQADANQSFVLSESPPVGTCRVTYGGNDQNGNVDPKKFGEACSPDPLAKGKVKENCYTFGGQAGAPSATSAKGGPFGEHTHHQKAGPAGDFVFRAGTRSAPKATRIEAITCKDEGACRQAAANGNFKQIDFDGTGSFRVLDATAKAYLIGKGAPPDIDTDNVSNRVYYFRVDMDDLGEPGNQWATGKKSVVSDLRANCQAFFNEDQNNPLASPDPLFMDYFGGYSQAQACSSCPDVYQIRIYSGDSRDNPGNLMYEVRGFLTGGNIQIHRLIR